MVYAYNFKAFQIPSSSNTKINIKTQINTNWWALLAQGDTIKGRNTEITARNPRKNMSPPSSGSKNTSSEIPVGSSAVCYMSGRVSAIYTATTFRMKYKYLILRSYGGAQYDMGVLSKRNMEKILSTFPKWVYFS
jgi:hypothetical protein